MITTSYSNDKIGVRSKSRTNKMLAGTGYILTDIKQITPTLKENLVNDCHLSSAVTASTMKASIQQQIGLKRKAGMQIGKQS